MANLGAGDGGECVSHALAVDLDVSASTQNQALSALLLLYRELLERDLALEGVVRARTKRRLPVVMTIEKVRAVLDRLVGVEALVAGVLYGGGLRLMEALRLRIHDVDVQRRQITVRQGKGGKDRRTIQELMGHKDINPTMIYTHVLNRGPLGVPSPADLFLTKRTVIGELAHRTRIDSALRKS